MRILAALVALFTLAACGEPAAPGAPDPATEGNSSVILSNSRSLPDWLLIARQRSCDPGENCPRGEVHYNQRTVTRNAADNTADIWIQVRHGSNQLYQLESETTETTIRYELERLHYRFNCETAEFIVVERQIMGANETVIATDTPRAIYRAPARGSATAIIQPIACRGG
jgi:hypothetical protein